MRHQDKKIYPVVIYLRGSAVELVDGLHGQWQIKSTKRYGSETKLPPINL